MQGKGSKVRGKHEKNNYGRTNVLKKLWTWEVWQPADFFWADTRVG